MSDVLAFLKSAAPWICTGLLLIVFFIKEGNRKPGKKGKKQKEDYGTEGMVLGMCLGLALALGLHFDIAFGISLGMLLGLLLGSY